MKFILRPFFVLLLTGLMIGSLDRSALAFGPGIAQEFQISPTAVGEGAYPDFSATFISMSYNALVDQQAVNGVGTFQEQGFVRFNNFQDASQANLAANDTGLNAGPGAAGYNMYVTFTTSGTVAPNNPADLSQGLTATLQNFTFNWYVDIDRNTTFADLSGAGLGGGADDDGAATNTTPFVTGGTLDDILVAHSGFFVSGVAHAFAQQGEGDFDVITQFLRDNNFFANPFFANLLILINPNGNNGEVNTFGQPSAGNFTDAFFLGNGSVSFVAAVPEPSSFLLLGAGLLGLAGFARARFGKK